MTYVRGLARRLRRLESKTSMLDVQPMTMYVERHPPAVVLELGQEYSLPPIEPGEVRPLGKIPVEEEEL